MTKLARRRVLAGIAGIGAGGLAAPHIARAAVRVLRIGYSNSDTSQFGVGAQAFADAVAADPVLRSVLKVERHGNSELGDDPSMLKACVAGTLDSVLMANSLLSNVVPEFGVMNAPFLFRDVKSARAVLDGPIGAELVALGESRGMHILAWGENGLRQITANRPVRTVADLHGLKIRVPQSDAMLNGFLALGADAKPLAWSLVRNALTSGEFQAEENPVATIEVNKLNEVQKVLSLTGHIYDCAGFIVSPDLLDDLEEKQVVALRACAAKGGAVTRQVCETAQTEGIARLRAAGMTVVEDIDLAGFRAAARPFIETMGGKYPSAQVKGLLAAVA